jgi:phosphomannomutase
VSEKECGEEFFQRCEAGDSISVYYGSKENNGYTFIESDNHDLRLKQEEELKEYIGKEIDVYVYKSENKLKYLADNKYPVIFNHYKRYSRYLLDGDIIQGILSSVKLGRNNLRLVLTDLKFQHSIPLQNSVDETTMQNLKNNVDETTMQKLKRYVFHRWGKYIGKYHKNISSATS